MNSSYIELKFVAENTAYIIKFLIRKTTSLKNLFQQIRFFFVSLLPKTVKVFDVS